MVTEIQYFIWKTQHIRPQSGAGNYNFRKNISMSLFSPSIKKHEYALGKFYYNAHQTLVFSSQKQRCTVGSIESASWSVGSIESVSWSVGSIVSLLKV